MPGNTPNLLEFEVIRVSVKITILIILMFYAIFALIVVRQVDLMGKTLVTKVSPILKAFSIVHAGFGVGLIILAFGIL